MNTAFQPNTQPTAATLLVAASKIVAASALALGDDYDATIEIVAQGLSKLTAAEVDDFAAHGSDPAFAIQIIDAALTDTDTETGSDTVAEVCANTSATANMSATVPAAAIQAAVPAMETTPAKMMLTMIKQVMLPMAERLVELEDRLA